ncbi:hypothetical protein EC991_006667 [Linnemannia zychae]|nr:hypothetical protein EC991_006667 [Linnemannia zychae]
MEPKEDKPSVAQLRSLLNRTTRIKITDGRIFVGQFMCIDHSKNIILSAAHEYRTTSKTPPESAKGAGDSLDTDSNNKASETGDEDIPLTTLSTSAPQEATPSILATGRSRKMEEEGRSCARSVTSRE